jgi:hypothetical protein
VKPGDKIRLRDFDPGYTGGLKKKEAAKERTRDRVGRGRRFINSVFINTYDATPRVTE